MMLPDLDFLARRSSGRYCWTLNSWYWSDRILGNYNEPAKRSPVMMKPSGRSRILLVLLVIYTISDILLTPLGGLETRNPANLTTFGLATIGLLFTGLALGIVSLLLLFYKPCKSPILAIIAGILFLPAFFTEQAGYFSSSRPPIAIQTLEIIQTLISLVTIFVAASISRQKTP
jgi:hypothetical protein